MLQAYYLLYSVYRGLQELGAARYRSTLRLRAALLLAFWAALTLLLPLLAVAGWQSLFDPVHLLGGLFIGVVTALTWINHGLFSRPAWHRYLLLFRSYPRRRRVLGSAAVLAALLLTPALPFFLLNRFFF